jgi:hypothetical protein
MPQFSSLREYAGLAVGWLWAPGIAAIAAARRSRMFHPDGIVLTARVEPNTASGDSGMQALADRLAGPAIVRFSSALWKGEVEWPDALGCAVRFGARDDETLEAGDQDMLFATIRSPLTLPFAPFTTSAHDYLANTYWAVAPFDVLGVGRVKWRLVPEKPSASAAEQTRADKLLSAVSDSTALRLELRRTWRPGWVSVARIVLEAEVSVDQARLRMSPFRTGRGIEPRGFVHALRKGAYAASQAVRPRETTSAGCPGCQAH